MDRIRTLPIEKLGKIWYNVKVQISAILEERMVQYG